MDNQQITQTNLEQVFKQDLHQYLLDKNKIDATLPDAPDIEGLWPKIGESYLPDAIREFAHYPTVSLGWIMYVGMAIARYWDEDWELYAKVPDLYKHLCEAIDFDHLDDYVCDKVLGLAEDEKQMLRNIVAECAARTYSLLRHQRLQPGTEEAFRGFVAALHQMYLMGAAIELKSLGYHMTRLS